MALRRVGPDRSQGLSLGQAPLRPEKTDLLHQRRLGRLCPAKRIREVNPPARIRVHPFDTPMLDVLGHGATNTRPGDPASDASIASLTCSKGNTGPSSSLSLSSPD